MASHVDIVAILYPKQGKADRMVELLSAMSQYIKENEHGTLKYEINREVNKKSGAEEIIMVERYKDKAALSAHGSSKEFKAFVKKMEEEGLVEKPMQLKFVKPVGGFARL